MAAGNAGAVGAIGDEDGTGMGEYFQRIVDLQASDEEADELGASVLAWLVDSGVVEATDRDYHDWPGGGYAPGPCYETAVVEPREELDLRWNNGLHVITGRTVFYSDGVDAIACPACQTAVAWGQLSDAIDEWYAAGAGTRRCGGCGRVMGLNDWRWQPPWGFGYLGFEFWNWPPLAQGFIAEVGRRLGHRTVLVAGKL
jgi:hypothetical protein